MKLSKEQVEGINLVDLACSVYVSGLRLRETVLELYTDLEKVQAELAEAYEYAKLNADAASGLNLALAELWELVDAVDYNSTNVFCNDISGRNWFDRRNDLRRE